MKLERTLFHKSYLYFFVFFLWVLVAFLFTYFTKLLVQKSYRMHVYGITMMLWCGMLITQAYLIHAKKHARHKQIGMFSYLLVPLIIFTTGDLLYFKMAKVSSLGERHLFFIALVINALIAFIIFYGLAIANRKRPLIHARYMICTTFPLFTPVTDRITNVYFPFVKFHLPVIAGRPAVPIIGFIMADLILIGLCIWDWRSHRRWNVFPLALIVMLIYHYSVLNFYKFPFWLSFNNWLFDK